MIEERGLCCVFKEQDTLWYSNQAWTEANEQEHAVKGALALED